MSSIGHARGESARPPVAHPGRFNPWAVASVVTGIVSVGIMVFFSLITLVPIGVGLGHVALHRVRLRGESGRGLAVAGLAMAYGLTGLSLVMNVLFWIS